MGIGITRSSLAEKIRRRLGAPKIKVELDPQQIYDHIDYARNKYVKWATGASNQEVFFTMQLSGGQHLYEMPTGVVEIVQYTASAGSNSGTGSINTLFTVDNYLYNMGVFDALVKSDYSGYNIVSYHVAMDFLDTVSRYNVEKYNYKYHRYENLLELQPPPTSSQWILLRTYMLEGSTLDGWTMEKGNMDFYTEGWILDFATALCKQSLGLIRRKFANFSSIGNQGISLDGDSLISEGREDADRLMESLKNEEVFDHVYGIYIGF